MHRAFLWRDYYGGFGLILAGAVILIDQLLKLLVVNTIKVDGAVTVIDPLLRFVYVENKGAAFGLLENQRWIFISLTAVVILIFIIALFRTKTKSKLFFISAGMIIGGGIGNLIDRVFLGYVIDYIQLSFFPPVCNFADYCITAGTILFVIYIFFVSDFFQKKETLRSSIKENE